jgi:16S rRNA (guanine966-N2)-methyltransferase
MRIISGLYKNRILVSPKGLTTRPTSEKLRGSLFNICQSYVEGAEFLDLFAGSGAMGIEALSRGAQHATFVDSDRESIRCIQENLQELSIKEKGRVLKGDVFEQMDKLTKQEKQYDIIYADPPYDALSKFQGKLISFSSRVVMLVDGCGLLKKGGVLFIEDSKDAQPEGLQLQTLKLMNSRQMGRSVLQQYQHG